MMRQDGEGHANLSNESIRSEAVANLQFPASVHKALEDAGVTTIGMLIQLDERQLHERFGSVAARVISDSLAILESVNSGRQGVDWIEYWRVRGIDLVPNGLSDDASNAEVFQLVTVTAEAVLKHEFRDGQSSERAWRILQYRFALHGKSKLTLEELGSAFALTRERVRQIEATALTKLREALIEGRFIGKLYRVHPRVLDLVDTLRQSITRAPSQVALETNVAQKARQAAQVDLVENKSTLELIFAMAGFQRLEFADVDLQPVWGVFDAVNRKFLERGVAAIHQLLTKHTVSPLDEMEVLVRLNKVAKRSERLTLAQLEWLVPLCSSVERREDGRVWGKFEFLEGRGNQIERLLIEANAPLSVRSIVRDINHRMARAGRKGVELRNLHNQMITDGRFTAVGNSSLWGLKSWGHLETRSITKLMEEFLATTNKPATVKEIYEYVAQRRPVKENSVVMYLANEDMFVRTDRVRWGLSHWSEAQEAITWNREQVAKFVAELFKQQRVKELEFKVVKQALVEAAGVSEREAQGLLAKNPAITVRKGERWNERYAVFQPDYKSRLVQTSYARKNKTLRQRVTDAATRILGEREAKEMALAELVLRLQQEFNCPKHTLYQYIARIEAVESLSVPGSSVKLCRLKGVTIHASYPVVEQLDDSGLRERIERALNKMTEADVDLALFLLSKEFEAVLKRYLVDANSKGVIAVNLGKDPERWKLANMVDFVRNQQIIQDAGALQYLREQRNDRAHGSMPTLDERQLMLKTAPHFAEMYIGYIRIFDDLRRRLPA
jgi:hypothetical protein